MPVPSKVPFLRRRRKEQQKIADDDVGEQIPRDVFPSDGPKVEGRCNDIVTRELAEEEKKKKDQEIPTGGSPSSISLISCIEFSVRRPDKPGVVTSWHR